MMQRRSLCLLLGTLLLALAAAAEESIHVAGGGGRPISLAMRDASLAEVFEMLSRSEHVNVLLGEGVEGERSVSVNLYEVSVEQAIRAIAEAAGYLAERRRGTWVIVRREDAGKDAADGAAEVRSFRIQYSDPLVISTILQKHLSRYGEITVLEDRRLIVVEDLPDFVARVERMLLELDREPRQILIEAKVMEITLDESDTFGIDWSRTFSGGNATIGLRNLTTPGLAGFFFDFADGKYEVAIEALSEKGRVRTLSTPRLLALEYEEAEVVIGDKLGFRVTTTINQVTTESVEFLESGVILKFKGAVDDQGRVMLEIHPEVSTGAIQDGLPNQTTTEVTTKLLVESGQKIFIGGLIRDTATQGRRGIPLLVDIPWLGRLFGSSTWTSINTETVVLLAAHVVPDGGARLSDERARRVPVVEELLEEKRRHLNSSFDHPWRDSEGYEKEVLEQDRQADQE